MKQNTPLDDYTILEKIGEGGFGETYLANYKLNGQIKNCVVKLLKCQTENIDSQALAYRLFSQETEVLEKLGSHEQIPALIDHFARDGRFYLVRELCLRVAGWMPVRH